MPIGSLFFETPAGIASAGLPVRFHGIVWIGHIGGMPSFIDGEARCRHEVRGRQQRIVAGQHVAIERIGQLPAQPQRLREVGGGEESTRHDAQIGEEAVIEWSRPQVALVDGVGLGRQDDAPGGHEQLVVGERHVLDDGAGLLEHANGLVDRCGDITRHLGLRGEEVARHADPEPLHPPMQAAPELRHRHVGTRRVERIVPAITSMVTAASSTDHVSGPQ